MFRHLKKGMILLTIKEQRRLELIKILEQPFYMRIKYLWYYYKWHVSICLILLAGIISYGIAVLNEPETVLNGLLLNSYNYSHYETLEEQTDELVKSYFEHKNLCTDQMQINLDTSRVYYVDGEDESFNYDTLQLMLACTAAESLDFVTGDDGALIDLAYMQFFWNLEEILSEELLEKYKSEILYIDMAVVREREDALDNNLDDTNIVFPDASKPELMEEPIPVLICVDDSTHLQKIYSQNKASVFFAFTSNDETGYTLQFLLYLLHCA